ncbi:MAG: carboxypeptidase-like regulatory domain-containing protein [Planctomycetota bacterium]
MSDHEDQGDIALTRGGRIEGRLVDPNGRTFAGANLRSALMLPGTESGRYGPGESTRQMLSERSILTDREGRFSFGSLPPGSHRLYFSDRSFLGFPHLDIELEAGEIRRDVKMVVERPATICGRVIDASGQAAAGATLIAGEPGARVRRCRTITVADGSFELPVAPGKVYDIQILPKDTRDAPSPGAATLALAIRAGTRDLEIALPTARRVEGVVQSPTGVPQSNVMIMACDALENRIAAETSDEAGRFSLDLPDATAVTLTFTARKERREGDRVLWVQDTSRTRDLTFQVTRDDSITVEVPWE